MANRERNIEQAIEALRNGDFKSLRAAGRAYGVPETTLRDRLKGSTNRVIAHQHQQKLTPLQEDFLADWILEEAARGQPPSHARARDMANRVVRMNGGTELLGVKWIQNFLKRNLRVASVVGRKIEAARADAASAEQVRAWMELFEATRTRYSIPHEHIYNMDETGLALGVCTNTQVLTSSKKKKAYKKTPENREWVSILECISATGRTLRPAVIFKGKSLQTTWFPSATVPDWLYTTSENGWTANCIGVEWLKRIFIPQTATPTEAWRLLLLDGHGSHISIEFSLIAKLSHVQLLLLPAHSSHVLQPLDLAPFSVLKSRYRREIAELSTIDDAAPVKKERFITSYAKARSEGRFQRRNQLRRSHPAYFEMWSNV